MQFRFPAVILGLAVVFDSLFGVENDRKTKGQTTSAEKDEYAYKEKGKIA